MNTFSFTSEDVSAEKGSNDDRILLAAVNLCSKSSLKTKSMGPVSYRFIEN